MPQYLIIHTNEIMQPDQPNGAEVYECNSIEEANEMFEYSLNDENLKYNVFLCRVVKKAEVTYRTETFKDDDGET